MMHAVLDWWISLWHHGLIGPLIACVVAAFVVLAIGNAIIWTLVWLKEIGRRAAVDLRFKKSEPKHPHQELRVVDERPVDHR